MNSKTLLKIFVVPFFLIVSCDDKTQLLESQRKEIIEHVELMANQFLLKLDAKQIDAAMSHIDSTATFYYIFLNGTIEISRDDIAAAYDTDISFKSKWNNMKIDPLTRTLAFFHGNFEQIPEDSTIENTGGRVIVSTIVILSDNNWKFFKGQIYSEQIKEE
jgi:hypothetical protein